ncbi:DUF1801 domain-containing protein [Streptomyces sp. H10-C2]|uniref:DUF1801 domain-containing protein n=1 Tax=unclassified Streptomyces TaxID=2593676 RepID=UPI0024BA4D42|nr:MULTISPECIES: DUF1801 domain-containing protein [unclassified Streptomyces]MDJ0345146.1 DUF1801 domain-containing protein [Streptomyces sp. PH10-H1]MDJ0374114.1 DUF1801 domain-containing protein [Streptomyces sp. H10-C2]
MATFATVQDYLSSLPATQREITGTLLPLIETALPGAGAVWHGHPGWSLGSAPGKSPVCYIKAYSAYVTFGFWRGQEITDPSGRLEPGARDMAGVKLRALTDIDADLFATWLQRARDLEASTGH